MRNVLILLAGVAVAAGCRHPRSDAASEIIALSIRTDPPGAKVKIEGVGRTWHTPCDVADASIRPGPLSVTVTLEGYEPATRRLNYTGREVLDLDLRLAAKRVARAPASQPAEPPKPVELPKPPDPAQGKPAEPGQTRIEIRGSGERVRVTVGGKVVAEMGTKPDEVVRLTIPGEKVRVEFLDAKTGAVTSAVDLDSEPAKARDPAPTKPPDSPRVKPDPTTDGERVGQVQLVHRVYGVFVRLDPNTRLSPGEEIVIYRDGKEVARTKIVQVTAAEESYPAGAARARGDGEVRKGDEVRRPK